MNQQETEGTLADGNLFRATPYMVEVRDPAGVLLQQVDANDIKEVQRKGQTVTIKRRKGGDITLQGASLDDAGRLEGALRRPAPPVVVAKKGGIGRTLRFGCLGLAGLVVLAIAGIAIAGSGGKDKKDNTSTSSGPKSGQDVRVALADGTAGTVRTAGDVTVRLTLTKVTDPAVSTNQFEKPSAGNRFVTYAFTIENAGTKETNGGDFTLRTADGFEVKQKFLSGVGAADLSSFQRLTSGGKANTVVAFEVPETATVQWLKFDPNSFASGDLYFDKQ